MTLTTSAALARHFDEPEGIAPRGTLIVLGGRGETPAVYERFGTRLARDAYRVRALGDATAEGIREAALELLRDPGAVSPLVLVGSDAGAAVALELAATHPDAVDAVIVAGLPVRAGEARASPSGPPARPTRGCSPARPTPVHAMRYCPRSCSRSPRAPCGRRCSRCTVRPTRSAPWRRRWPSTARPRAPRSTSSPTAGTTP
ncbi:hypothetical protein Q0F99_16230 [Rathayibacter oskolensis]|uniref:alpha/beta hydrolase n=1 Tax=Rathayibacter oskolensis TaxID=1891671 RepID=UPI00265DE0E6|nr:hypothetical protein [Rathayibacter oskolensis]WKK71119.1 hypothetical protein Q0F99_16230 [Rathayibacter oskolensis]